MKKLKKLKIGDMVETLPFVRKIRFVIKEIKCCPIEKCYCCNENYGCPGYINGVCYGYGDELKLKKIGSGNPNNKIIIKE